MTDGPLPASFGENVDFELEVLRSWKGELGRRVTITTAKNGSMCGYGFERHGTYVVYAQALRDGTLMTGICSRTRESILAEKDLAFLKTRPTPYPRSPGCAVTRPTDTGWGALGPLLALGLVGLRSRGRR